MLTALSAAAGTTVGKIVLTGTAAAAIVTGAAATDAIDVPGIGPDTEIVSTFDDSTDDSPSSSSTMTSTSTTAPASTSSTTASPTITAAIEVAGLGLPDIDNTTISAADAGTLTVRVLDGQLVPVSIDPADGWTATDESSPSENEIEVSFRRGGDRVDVEIEIDDGMVRVRVRDRRTDEETFTNLDGTPFVADDDSDDDHDDDSDDDHDDDSDDR